MADTKTTDTKHADTTKHAEDAKKKLAANNEARQKAREEHEKKTRGTPVPTQEECDLIKLGQHPELAKDGSQEEEQPSADATHQTRHIEAGSSGGGYETRQSTPAATHHKPPTQHSSS